jgi:hypothetical protein
MMKNDTDTNPTTPTLEERQVLQKIPLFSVGTVVTTPAVWEHFLENNIDLEDYLIRRHLRSDWGDVPPEDAVANDFAVLNGLRILSAYVAANRRFWIITEADRSVTTFLFPEEY